MAVDGKGSRSLEVQVDETGALHPASMLEPAAPPSGKPGRSDWTEQRVAAQALLLRLSVATRIGAHPGAIETSFPVQLSVLGAGRPLNPILFVKPTEPDAFVADANDETSIPSPQQKRRFIPMLGLGILGGALGGTPGRIVGVTATVVTAWLLTRSGQSGPQPVDVKLPITGQMAERRLQETESGSGPDILFLEGRFRPFATQRWSQNDVCSHA